MGLTFRFSGIGSLAGIDGLEAGSTACLPLAGSLKGDQMSLTTLITLKTRSLDKKARHNNINKAISSPGR